MVTKKNKPANKARRLIVYEDKESGTIFLRPCSWKDGKYKLKHRSVGKFFPKFSAFNAELGKQVKKYLKLCD